MIEKNYQPKLPVIRSLLKNGKNEGMSVNEIEAKTGFNQVTLRKCLNRMPDAYIDRWFYPHGCGHPTAIWCVVDVPENCPKPNKRKIKE